MSKLINSYSFWRSSYPFGGLILLGEFRSRFSYVVNLIWRQMFLRKLQLAAKYWNI